jgi:hypothetical protein
MEDVEDEPLFADRVAGIDIAKAGAEPRSPSGCPVTRTLAGASRRPGPSE